MQVNGIDFEFNFRDKGGGFALQVQKLMAENSPFVMEKKSTFDVYLPGLLKAYYSAGERWINFPTIDAMHVSLGLSVMACKNIISEKSEVLKFLKMPKVKALQTLHGSYGLANTGDIVEVETERAAKKLVDDGLAERVSDETDVTKEKKEVDPSKSSIKMEDKTDKEKKNILKP